MKKEKASYSVLSNVGWMLGMARKSVGSVPFWCAVISVLTVAQSVVQMTAVPAILDQVQRRESLSGLLAAVGLFALGLMALQWLLSYLQETTIYGRISVREKIIGTINRKTACTAYPNLLDPEVLKVQDEALSTTYGNAEASEHIWTTLQKLLANVLGFGVYLAVLTKLHPLVLAVTLVTTAAGFLVQQRLQSWGYRRREEKDALNRLPEYLSRLVENREFAKDIRIFHMAPWLRELHEKSERLIQDFLRREYRAYLWADVLEVALSFLRNGFAYLVLIGMVLENKISAAEFVLYFSAVGGFTTWITGILRCYLELARESLKLCRVREYLATPEPFRQEGSRPIPQAEGYALRMENVTFRYPGAEAPTIAHMDLTIRPGERVAIVGENGAGKTTLVKLLCGLLDPTEGRVLLNGVDIREFNRQDYYRLFSAVFQEFATLECTIRENITQTNGAWNEEKLWDCVEKAGLTEKISALGLEAHLGRQVYEDGVELSGGEIQRLMLARALYKDGSVLVLDEPTAALDPLAEHDIYCKYDAMSAGKTSLYISHRLASTRFCDRILLLEHGGILEEGTHEALLARQGAYAAMFAIQRKYYEEEEAV